MMFDQPASHQSSQQPESVICQSLINEQNPLMPFESLNGAATWLVIIVWRRVGQIPNQFQHRMQPCCASTVPPVPRLAEYELARWWRGCLGQANTTHRFLVP
jgi:hypothetical protein